LKNKKLLPILLAKPVAHFTLGVKPMVELKSNIPIGPITEINLKGFTLGVKAENENNFF
jgi:hypothetical protein